MSQSNKKSTRKKKHKKRTSGNNTTNHNSSDKQNNTSKLCCFSSTDYIVLASTLAIALGEELSTTDISILSTFFAVLSDELALIGSFQSCGDNGDDSIFVPPVPDVAVTCSKNKNKKYTKKKK